MSGFKKHSGLIAPLNETNVDTDVIIPKQFLQKVTRHGYGKHLFHNWRFLDNEGQKLNPSFVLNKPQYQKASILLTRENFGCGSSREHAPWALADYGFKVIIASSFADIFYGNSIFNQLVPVKLKENEIDEIFNFVEQNENVRATVDLQEKSVTMGLKKYSFEIDEFNRYCLLEGLDNICLTLRHENKIKTYESLIPNFLN